MKTIKNSDTIVKIEEIDNDTEIKDIVIKVLNKIGTPYIEKFEELIDNMQKVYDNVKHIQDQKEYALKVKDTPFSSIMFIAKKLGDCNILQVFNKQDTQLKTKILSKVV